MPDLPRPVPENYGPDARQPLAEAFRRAQAHPQDAGANGSLGMLLHAYEQFEAAADCYRRAWALDRQNERWPYYLGRIVAAQGRDTDAVACFRPAVDAGYAPARLAAAASLLALNRLEESRELFQEAASSDPRSAAAHYGAGRALASQAKAAEAVKALRKASELAPRSGAAHYALALAYRDTGEVDKSQRHLTLAQALQRVPPSVEDPWMDAVMSLRKDRHRYLNEGRRLESEGRLGEAKDAYERAIAVDPEYAQAHVNLVAMYGALGRLDKAEQHYRHALEINPNFEELHKNWGTVLVMRNQPREAAEAFRRALRINPHSADSHQDLGYCLQALGRTGEALAHYREALNNDPAHRGAHFQLGRYYALQGRFEQGLEHLLRTADPVDQRTPQYLHAIADVYARSGQRQQAIHYASRAHQLALGFGQSRVASLIEQDLRTLQSAR